MHRLTIRLTSGEPFDVVLRRWTHDPWATGLVRRESAGLTELAKHDLPVPSLIATDPTGAESGVPALLMTAVPGETLLVPDDLHDYVTQLAHVLLRIHELPAELDPTDPHGYEENADRSWIGDLALRRTAEDAAATTGDSQQVLVHGDYHQLNVLWLGQQLSGVVDWSYTGRGQRGIDVGYCRLTLAVLFSADAAAQFLCCYEAESGLRVDPHADIRGLLNFDSGWLDFIPRVVAGRAPSIWPVWPAG